MLEVKSRDAEKCRAEHHGAAGGISSQPPAVVKDVEPLAQVQGGKNDPQEYRPSEPFKARGLAACLGGLHRAEHREAAGEEDGGHDHAINNAGGKLERM